MWINGFCFFWGGVLEWILDKGFTSSSWNFDVGRGPGMNFFLVFLLSTRYKVTLSAMKKCDFIRGVTSLDWDNLVVFYYLSDSGIWPDKKGGLWWEGPYKRETTVFPIWKEYGVCADYALYNPELFIIFKIYFSVHNVYVLKALFQEIHSHN